VRAFGLTPQTIAAAPEFGPSVARAPTIRRRHWIAAVLAVVITAAGASAWWLVGRPLMVLPPNDAMVPAPAPASIAVLPFVSLGADGGSDYFADGLTEDIISALGRFRDLSVMSRGAVFAYKGKNSTPSEVGRDLKVRYIVDGSIRRAPERIRVSVGLTDTNRGTVLWSEKYEVEPKDVFAVEDQITRRISGALAVRVTSLELARAVVIPPSNLEAYDLVLRGRDLLNRLTRSGNAVARGVFERAIGLDPNYSPAYVGLGWVNLNSVTQGWTQHPVEALEQSGNLARKAIELDDLNATGHALLGNVALHFGEHERALEELKRAIDLNSSDAESYSSLLSVLLYAGDVSGAIATGELVAQFQPDLPAHTAFHLGIAYLLSDRGADAIRVLEHSVDRNPGNLYSNLILATAYAAVGRQREAEQLTQRIRERFPTFSHEQVGAALRDPELRAKLDRALEKAGL
jgi:TolB-like protein/Flp pilus assembly protein TadD